MTLDPLTDLVLQNAIEKKVNSEKLTQVETVVLREYVHQLRAELMKFELKAQHKILSDVDYTRMQELQTRIKAYE